MFLFFLCLKQKQKLLTACSFVLDFKLIELSSKLNRSQGRLFLLRHEPVKDLFFKFLLAHEPMRIVTCPPNYGAIPSEKTYLHQKHLPPFLWDISETITRDSKYP